MKSMFAMCMSVVVVAVAMQSQAEPPLATNVVAELSKLCSLDDPDLSEYALMEGSFEIRCESNLYSPLVVAMSNNWENVLSNMPAYATNSVERMLLLNTGWWLGESLHVEYIKKMCDMVEGGSLPPAEFEACMRASWNNHPVGSVLARRYDEPAISNLISRITVFSTDTNYWHEVSTGVLKEKYLEGIADGLWD